MNTNGHFNPESLARAFGSIIKSVQRGRREKRRGRIVLPPGVELAKLPRQICPLCSQVFDFAMIPSDTLPKHALCSKCKRSLADGWTFFVHVGEKPIMMRSEELKREGNAGKILPVSKEDYDRLQQIIPKEPNVP